MDARLVEAFEYLVPADQQLIAALILAMAAKDKQNHTLARELLSRLSDSASSSPSGESDAQ